MHTSGSLTVGYNILVIWPYRSLCRCFLSVTLHKVLAPIYSIHPCKGTTIDPILLHSCWAAFTRWLTETNTPNRKLWPLWCFHTWLECYDRFWARMGAGLIIPSFLYFVRKYLFRTVDWLLCASFVHRFANFLALGSSLCSFLSVPILVAFWM